MFGIGKIKEIVQSYATMVNPTEEQKEMAAIRLKTCMECDKWVDTTISYCKECGCATRSKVFSPKGIQACPLNKWEI